MTQKTLDEIWDDYLEYDPLPQKTKGDLIWHLQNNEDPVKAIILATDMGLKEVASYIAPYLDSEDGGIRETTVGHLVGRLSQVQYAEKTLQMAREDPDEGVRDLALSSLGSVINMVSRALRSQIAHHIVYVLNNPSFDSLHKESAYHAIEIAMDLPANEWNFSTSIDPDMNTIIDSDLYNAFKEKYGVED